MSVIYSCPDCGGDLEEDAHSMWCVTCECAVPYSLLVPDPESDPWF